MRRFLLAACFLAAPALAQAQLVCVDKDLAAALSLTLTWNDNSTNETGQIVERKVNGGPYSVLAAGVGANIITYTDGSVTRDFVPMTYTYRVSAFNTAFGATQVSLPSNEACATFAAMPPPPAPKAPSGLTLSAISSSQLQASWEDTPTETQYKLITVGQAPPRTYINYPAKDATSFIVGGLPRNKTFCATIAALLGVEESVPSNKQCATTQK